MWLVYFGQVESLLDELEEVELPSEPGQEGVTGALVEVFQVLLWHQF